jgi:hypothetical protein
MTSPRVIELPRRLEPVGRDTFLGVAEVGASRPVSYVGNVVALRPPDTNVQPGPPAAA